jgi:hypothetical protein
VTGPGAAATASGVRLSVEWIGATRTLIAQSVETAALAPLEGTVARGADGVIVRGPLSATNAEAARRLQPNLRPQLLGLHTSAGTGDRLGMATPGHVRAFTQLANPIAAIFAQQSIREMDRLGRTPQQVLDDATFGCIEAGWQGSVAADADHLKQASDIDRCLEAGFSLFTLDVGDFVADHAGHPTDADLAALPWHELEDDLDSARRRYAHLSVEGMTVSEADLAHAMAKYGRAITEGIRLYRHLIDRATYPVEVEIAVDETDEVTTPAEHIYIAAELKRLGADWVSFAPRHLGSFEKGVEFVGDPDALFASIRQHAAIARALGPYKIGMHSGSDKFSIYEGLTDATGGLVHLKTSGTSYLVALQVIARREPDLFRACYKVSNGAYLSARASYQVSAMTSSAPQLDELGDADLEELLVNRSSRQILHVGYGAVLSNRIDTASGVGADVRHAITRWHDDYYRSVAAHIGRHLDPYTRSL